MPIRKDPLRTRRPGAGLRIAFTHDSHFVIASSFPIKADTEKAVKERKRPDEMPKSCDVDCGPHGHVRLPGS